jgi:hypothetical protein
VTLTEPVLPPTEAALFAPMDRAQRRTDRARILDIAKGGLPPYLKAGPVATGPYRNPKRPRPDRAEQPPPYIRPSGPEPEEQEAAAAQARGYTVTDRRTRPTEPIRPLRPFPSAPPVNPTPWYMWGERAASLSPASDLPGPAETPAISPYSPDLPLLAMSGPWRALGG